MIKPFSILRLTCIVGTLTISEAQAHNGHSDVDSTTTSPNPKNLNYDDADNDVFAIPLDSSRRELDEEEEDLENLEQQNLQKQQK